MKAKSPVIRDFHHPSYRLHKTPHPRQHFGGVSVWSCSLKNVYLGPDHISSNAESKALPKIIEE